MESSIHSSFFASKVLFVNQPISVLFIDNRSQQRKRNKEQSNEAPIEEWIGLVQDKVDVLRMNNTVSLLFEWIAEFETHPEPSQCCGVDYASIYQYLAALMEGQVPRQLDPPSASKLLQMFQQVTKTISQSAAKSRELLAKTAKAPPPNVPVRPEIKNKVLRERVIIHSFIHSTLFFFFSAVRHRIVIVFRPLDAIR